MFDTSMVENMSGMFRNCSRLTSLNVSSFDTSNVKYMSSMFSACSSFTYLDLSNFNTINVEYMDSMFQDCANLTSVNLSSFYYSNIVNISKMFLDCRKLSGNIHFNKINDSKKLESYQFVFTKAGLFGSGKIRVYPARESGKDKIDKIITAYYYEKVIRGI